MIGKCGVFASACALLLFAAQANTAVIQPGQTISIPFTVNPALFGDAPNYIDVIIEGPIGFTPQADTGDLVVEIFNGTTLLGTYSPLHTIPVRVSSDFWVASFKSASADTNNFHPTMIEFSSVLDGSINGLLTISLPTSAMSLDTSKIHLLLTSYKSGSGHGVGGLQTRTGVLSHIAAGGPWDTTITLLNSSSAAVPATVTFRGDDGSVLSLPLKTTQQGTTQTTTASSMNVTINPNSTVLIATGALANTVVGWADVFSSGPVSGFAIMRSTPTNDKPSEASVPLQASFPSSITLPYDNTAGCVMGVALANLASGSANINATIWDESGTQLGVQQISIPGNGHTSFVLTDGLSRTTGNRGIVKFTNPSGGISGLGLRFSPSGPFTDVPVMLPQ